MIIVIWLTIERKSLQLTQKDNNYQRLFVLSVLAIQLRMILAGVSQMMMAKTLQRHVPNNPSWKASFPSEHMPFSLLVFCLDCFLISNF